MHMTDIEADLMIAKARIAELEQERDALINAQADLIEKIHVLIEKYKVCAEKKEA